MSTKQKNGVEETLDRISQLPDSLLVQIVSLLPTKDAVSSSLVSKKFRYLWTSIYSFLFCNIDYTTPVKFISFVDHVLTRSTCSKIEKFHLHLDNYYESPCNYDLEISRWISFAAERKVEDVVLHSYDQELTYELPLSIYSSSSLISLNLTRWGFEKGRHIAWNSLKSLRLYFIMLKDDEIVNLLSLCPALETLELSEFRGLRRLDITSSNLKRLTLAGHWSPDVESGLSLKIIAPHVQHLEISGDIGYQKCKLLNVSSLVTAHITCDINNITFSYDVEEYGRRDYHQVFRNFVLDCIQKLSYATELTFGNWLTEAIFKLQLDGVPLPELRCKCLTLKLHATNFTLYGIASLLQASPLLETLNIHLVDDIHFLLENYLAKTKNSNLRSWISNIVFPNVKNVKIVDCTWGCSNIWSKYKLFKLSNVLLKNAVVLKEFVIVAKRRKCQDCSENCVSQYLSRLAKKLLDSHRSSKKVVITYKEFALHDYTGSDYDRLPEEMLS